MKTKIDDILMNYENSGRDALIPLLQEIQEKEGFLSEEAIVKTGRQSTLNWGIAPRNRD